MVDIPAKDIVSWIYEEYKNLNPDIIIPIGHRIFNLLSLHRGEYKELDDMFDKIVQINAVHYIDCNDKRVMLIDEETEYGRKFFYDIFPQFKEFSPESVNCFTVFLRDDVKTQNERERLIQKWKATNPEVEKMTKCLHSIRSYRAYGSSEKFHNAIFNFREFIKSNLKRPYNMDATLFSLSFDKSFGEIENELNNHGPLFWYDEDVLTLFPDFFDVQRYNNLEGIQITDGTLSKLRFFKSYDGSLIVSPMAYFSIEFTTEKPRFDTEEVFNNHPLLYHIFKAWQECTGISLNNKNYIIQLYDLFVFWLDIELFRNFVQVLKRSDIDFKFEIEEHGCITHYGKILGNKLLKVIREAFDTFSQPSLDSYLKIKYDIDPYNIESNIATLLSIKAACLEQYSKRERESMHFERMGLTFSAIQNRLNLDPFSTSICIDLLCDNAALKPFDSVEKDLRVARFYNTDIEDFIGIFVKLFRRAETEGITIGRTNIGKFTTFINYFAITINDKSENPIKVRDAPQGKVIRVIYDEKEIDSRLEDLFTNYYQYKDVFYYKNGQYKVKAETPRALEHLDIIESETKLDSYLDIIFEIYKKLENYLDGHPEIVDSKGCRRNIYDVFPGFIELLGEGYPEGGLKIVGSLTKRALSYYERHLSGDTLGEKRNRKEEADKLLFHAIPHKIEMYQKFSEIYLECYKYLSNPYISIRRDVWKSMCVYSSNSLILELCNKIVFYMQEEIKSVLDIENESLQNRKLQNLRKKVIKFLDLMINCSIKTSNDSSKIQYLPKGTSENLYIVSMDLENSTNISVLGDPRWESIISYFINIMCRWAETCDGKLINLPGDEIIVAFQELTSARSFAAGCCIQLTELSESINQCETFERYTTGCYGRITHGLVKVDENGDCISKELNIMCKYLPKKEGKIVINSDIIKECIDFSGSEFVDGERSYCIIDSKEEFKRMILSQFE